MRHEKIAKNFGMSLVLLLMVGVPMREAFGQSSGNGPQIVELLSFQSSDYKFKIIPQNEQPPNGFERPGFDETSFVTSISEGRTPAAAFGSGGRCPLQPTVQTEWQVNTQLLLRRRIDVPSDARTNMPTATNLQIIVAVDNDVRVFFNGTPLIEHTLQTSNVIHEGCPVEFRFDVPQKMVLPGENVVAFQVRDRGVESFFDAKINAEMLIESYANVLPTEVPLVPVSGISLSCPAVQNLQTSVTIDYLVNATGEAGKIAIRNDKPHLPTIESFLNKQLVLSARADQNGVNISMSPMFEQPLAPGSVIAHKNVSTDLFQCLAQRSLAQSCKDKCEDARDDNLWLIGAFTVGGCLLGPLFCGGTIAIDAVLLNHANCELHDCYRSCGEPTGNLPMCEPVPNKAEGVFLEGRR